MPPTDQGRAPLSKETPVQIKVGAIIGAVCAIAAAAWGLANVRHGIEGRIHDIELKMTTAETEIERLRRQAILRGDFDTAMQLAEALNSGWVAPVIPRND